MEQIFDSSTTFADLGLRDSVLKSLDAAGFKHPTTIQAKLLPVILAGRDALGQAKTGTGKTAAFGLPILHMADKDTPMQALVLVPTRELAAQVAAELEELGKHTPIRTACIIGGESMRQQVSALKSGAQIIVGTPGRVLDMRGRGEISFDNIRFAVLDEVDRMLDIGFRDDIRKTLKMTPSSRQTIFVSATISEEIERLARTFMRDDAEKIVTTSGSLTVSQVTQYYLPVEPWAKRSLLRYILKHEEPDTTVIFCRTKATVHRLTQYLRDKKIEAREIHGDLQQSKRNRVMDQMRQGKLDVLVASDLAARGLDVEHISHVINYDLPEDPEVYIHRIGRTARAGRKGVAWSFVEPEQGRLLTDIEKLTGVLIEEKKYEGFDPGPAPEGYQRPQRDTERKLLDPSSTVAGRTASTDKFAGMSEQELKAMFPPDGIPPQSVPRQGLGSRLRTRRRR